MPALWRRAKMTIAPAHRHVAQQVQGVGEAGDAVLGIDDPGDLAAAMSPAPRPASAQARWRGWYRWMPSAIAHGAATATPA